MKRAKATAEEAEEPKNKKTKTRSEPSSSSGMNCAQPPVDVEIPDTFRGYSLAEIPTTAWPQQGPNKGLHSYTVKAPNGAAIWIHYVKQFSIFVHFYQC